MLRLSQKVLRSGKRESFSIVDQEIPKIGLTSTVYVTLAGMHSEYRHTHIFMLKSTVPEQVAKYKLLFDFEGKVMTFAAARKVQALIEAKHPTHQRRRGYLFHPTVGGQGILNACWSENCAV